MRPNLQNLYSTAWPRACFSTSEHYKQAASFLESLKTNYYSDTAWTLTKGRKGKQDEHSMCSESAEHIPWEHTQGGTKSGGTGFLGDLPTGESTKWNLSLRLHFLLGTAS